MLTDGPKDSESPETRGVAEQAVLDALRWVVDPELGADIVELGMFRGFVFDPSGTIHVDLAITVASCPLRSQISSDIRQRLIRLPGVKDVEVHTVEMTAAERSDLMAKARWNARSKAAKTNIPRDAPVMVIASGKGGVGKSSVAVNLATTLALRGLEVGLLDADIWGYSIPRMLHLDGDINVRSSKMLPISKPIGPGRIKVISMGFLASEDSAIMWRGLLLNRAVQQFLEDVNWEGIDYLVVDLPPGTGDVQMGLSRMLPRAAMLVVTTPSLSAQRVAARAADMARKGYLRVAGVIENMAPFRCEHGETYALFGSGGGQRLADELGVPLLGSIPLDPAVGSGNDLGVPIALDSTSDTAEAYKNIAEQLANEIRSHNAMAGCSARMLRSVNDALERQHTNGPDHSEIVG